MNREMGHVVILLAHPKLQESSANKELYNTVKEMDNVSVYNLYDEVNEPFDAEEWSRILTDASALVLQFPFHWMAAPYMLKRWEDEVLTVLAGTPSLAGKPLMVVVTTGADSESYRSGGRNRFTVDELLRPYQAAAILSGMVWQTPLIIYGTGNEDPAKNIAQGAIQYRKSIDALLKSKNLVSVVSW